jgi:putative spermidine/putrescine transport system substrate-binding protein
MPGPADVLRPAEGGRARRSGGLFIELATSPAVQAEGIVERFNWYPGIDAQHVQAELDDATWQRLFADVGPEDLASKGKPFPIGPYFDQILEAYERQVTN